MSELKLSDLEFRVLNLGDRAVEIVKEVLDKHAHEFTAAMQRTIPRKTGALAASVKVKQIDKKEHYGWAIAFKGKTAKGKEYHEIAYTLNAKGYGRWDTSDIATISIIGFISQAVSDLKRINEEINERWHEEVMNG